MISPAKEILEQLCKDYEQILRYKDKDGEKSTCKFATDAMRMESSNEMYNGNACIVVNTLPVYKESFAHADPETAIAKACFRLLNNLMFYGLGSAHLDLQDAIEGKKPFIGTINFGE